MTPEERKAYNRAYGKEYRKTNKKILVAKQKEWKKNNPDNVKASEKKWRVNNPTYKPNYVKHRKSIDPLYKLTSNIRSLIRQSFRYNGIRKTTLSEQILGCSFIEFKLHLESKFQDWMNWDNYGKYNGELGYGWDIDHIIPLATATCEEDIIRLNHYTNLQPLCSFTNRNIKMDDF
jgi:hypothetical protein